MDDNFRIALEDWFEAKQVENEQLLIKYPPDVPNEKGYHAYIKGMSVENSFCPDVGEYNLLFQTENEKIYVWTHTKNKESALVSEINLCVKEKPFWKTVGSMITLSQAYYEAFEGIDFDSKLDYRFMYYFSPFLSIDDVAFFDMSNIEFAFLHNGRVVKATDIANMAPLIELMVRDDKCYTAVSLLFSSFQIHYCCLICELGLSPIRKHESHEPKIWEQADYITKMESGIVQACRCAESILGEPPNQGKRNRILAHKQKWLNLVGINPDDEFEKSGTSYWDFYLRLFDELRNPSAHSYGDIHFDLERKRTIEAQCFAAIILRGYIQQNESPFEEAQGILSFNKDFLCRVVEDMSTPLTKDDYEKHFTRRP